MKLQNFSRYFSLCALLFAVLSASLLSGCSTMRVIESQVQTSTQWPPQNAAPTQALFRLERLPADVNNLQAGWAEVELESALAPLGWKRNDVDAQYSAWIDVRSAEFIADPWGRPVRGPWAHQVRINIGTGYRPHGFGFGMRPGFPAPMGYVQEVNIIIRDLTSSHVVYQTKATHDGPWSDHPNILRAMISAALQGFPNPSAKIRQVNTTISR
jgi:hypothetical protein